MSPDQISTFSIYKGLNAIFWPSHINYQPVPLVLTQYHLVLGSKHCCPKLTQYTASLPHNAQLNQLDLVYCSYPSSREERYEAETLRHHQAALLYNVLEPDWLQNSGTAADDGTKTLDEEHSNQNMNRSQLWSVQLYISVQIIWSISLPRSVDISLKDDQTVRDGPYADDEVIQGNNLLAPQVF